MLGVVARVFAITIIPLAIGMRIRARNPARAIALEPRASESPSWSSSGVVVGAVINEFGTVTDHFTELALRGPHPQRRCDDDLVLDRAPRAPRRAPVHGDRDGARVHNAALAIAVGTSIDDLLGIPAAVYSVFQLFTAGAFARLMHRRNTVGADDSLAAGAHAPVS